jgi:hypothetical protein
MMPPGEPVEDVLRRAVAKAGLVVGYRHVCRRHGCGHAEDAPDKALRRCPTDGHKLWPKAKVRPIRFHSLRHTTASLLMMAGANPAAVQRIMRHSDPRITTEVYGHLAPGYLQAEADRLKLGISPEAPEEKPLALVANLTPFAAPLLHEPESRENATETSAENPHKIAGMEWSGRRDLNSRPPAPKAGALPG